MRYKEGTREGVNPYIELAVVVEVRLVVEVVVQLTYLEGAVAWPCASYRRQSDQQ